jgi:hypothetical protein
MPSDPVHPQTAARLLVTFCKGITQAGNPGLPKHFFCTERIGENLDKPLPNSSAFRSR